jgi:hypothetical protein
MGEQKSSVMYVTCVGYRYHVSYQESSMLVR